MSSNDVHEAMSHEDLLEDKECEGCGKNHVTEIRKALPRMALLLGATEQFVSTPDEACFPDEDESAAIHSYVHNYINDRLESFMQNMFMSGVHDPREAMHRLAVIFMTVGVWVGFATKHAFPKTIEFTLSEEEIQSFVDEHWDDHIKAAARINEDPVVRFLKTVGAVPEDWDGDPSSLTDIMAVKIPVDDESASEGGDTDVPGMYL